MKKILIVEDDIYTQDILTRAVNENYDFDVLIAKDGMEGLERILTESPDIIILDIALPQMDGITMLEKLRFTHDYVKANIIVVTAAADTHTISKCKALGVAEYVIKPFTPTDIFDAINKTFNR